MFGRTHPSNFDSVRSNEAKRTRKCRIEWISSSSVDISSSQAGCPLLCWAGTIQVIRYVKNRPLIYTSSIVFLFMHSPKVSKRPDFDKHNFKRVGETEIPLADDMQGSQRLWSMETDGQTAEHAREPQWIIQLRVFLEGAELRTGRIRDIFHSRSGDWRPRER